MTEFQQAFRLANKVLERVNEDPDDDLAVLARQFLRSVERENFLRQRPLEDCTDQ